MVGVGVGPGTAVGVGIAYPRRSARVGNPASPLRLSDGLHPPVLGFCGDAGADAAGLGTGVATTLGAGVALADGVAVGNSRGSTVTGIDRFFP